MPSELWQRLREARKFANKTQLDMAKIAGVTRSGYAFWETPDDDSRTRPNSDQIVAICKATKVPVEWLLDDKANVSDIWRDSRAIITQASAPRPEPTAEVYGSQIANSERAQQRFWAAVEYIVTTRDPRKDGAFGRPVHAGAIELQADYQWENTLAVFSRQAGDEEVLRTVGHMLVLARASKARDPKLLILLRSEARPQAALVESCRRFLSVSVEFVETPEQAAALLLQ